MLAPVLPGEEERALGGGQQGRRGAPRDGGARPEALAQRQPGPRPPQELLQLPQERRGNLPPEALLAGRAPRPVREGLRGLLGGPRQHGVAPQERRRAPALHHPVASPPGRPADEAAGREGLARACREAALRPAEGPTGAQDALRLPLSAPPQAGPQHPPRPTLVPHKRQRQRLRGGRLRGAAPRRAPPAAQARGGLAV